MNKVILQGHRYISVVCHRNNLLTLQEQFCLPGLGWVRAAIHFFFYCCILKIARINMTKLNLSDFEVNNVVESSHISRICNTGEFFFKKEVWTGPAYNKQLYAADIIMNKMVKNGLANGCALKKGHFLCTAMLSVSSVAWIWNQGLSTLLGHSGTCLV